MRKTLILLFLLCATVLSAAPRTVVIEEFTRVSG